MGGVDYTNSIPLSVSDGRTDRQIDRGNLMPPQTVENEISPAEYEINNVICHFDIYMRRI